MDNFRILSNMSDNFKVLYMGALHDMKGGSSVRDHILPMVACTALLLVFSLCAEIAFCGSPGFPIDATSDWDLVEYIDFDGKCSVHPIDWPVYPRVVNFLRWGGIPLPQPAYPTSGATGKKGLCDRVGRDIDYRKRLARTAHPDGKTQSLSVAPYPARSETRTSTPVTKSGGKQ